jgi:drug/metabolite transporter (DMT)-like permease
VLLSNGLRGPMVRIFDYESKDCGFESHRDLELLLLLLLSISSPLYLYLLIAAAANEWVCSTVGSRRLLRMREVTGSSPVESTFCFLPCCLLFCSVPLFSPLLLCSRRYPYSSFRSSHNKS